jgi:hypothetical protein
VLSPGASERVSRRNFRLAAAATARVRSSHHSPPTPIPPKTQTQTQTECPVKGKPFAKADFDVEEVGGMLPLLMSAQAEGTVSQRCVDLGVEQLAACASDGTLGLEEGCCTTACAAGLKKADSCLLSYVKAVCADKAEGPKYQKGLFSAARRCVGLEPSCAGGGKLVNVSAAAAAGAGAVKNATAAAAAAVKNATAALAAPAAAAAAAPAAAASGAVSGAAATTAVVAALAAAVLA